MVASASPFFLSELTLPPQSTVMSHQVLQFLFIRSKSEGGSKSNGEEYFGVAAKKALQEGESKMMSVKHNAT